jgi:uncharacterized protein YjbI with pentapeptide repeats
MGDGTAQNPYTREDVLRLIEENGGTANRLNLFGKVFEKNINLGCIDLKGICLMETHLEGANMVAAHLEDAVLMGIHLEEANLGDIYLEGADLMGAYLQGASLMQAHLKKACFADAYLNGSALSGANIEGADFGGSNLEGAVLDNVRFNINTNFHNVKWGNYVLGEDREGEVREGNDRIMWFNFAVTTYRRLKIWYTENGIYDVAGEFYYREMEAKRKAQSWKKAPASKLWSWVVRLLCGYGERYGNVAVAALVIIFGLAVVYVYGGLNLANAIYFSAVSFVALGYGSWVDTPISWVRGLGVAEAFLGVFMMALFLVTFTRKMTR